MTRMARKLPRFPFVFFTERWICFSLASSSAFPTIRTRAKTETRAKVFTMLLNGQVQIHLNSKMSRMSLHTKHLKQYDLAPKASSRQILNFQLSRRSAQWPSGRAISPTKYLTSQPSETKISTKNALPLDLSRERSSQRDIQIDIDLGLKSSPKIIHPPKILSFLFPRTCTSQPLPPITQS